MQVDVLSFLILNVVPIWTISTTNPPQVAQKPIGVNFESAEHVDFPFTIKSSVQLI